MLGLGLMSSSPSDAIGALDPFGHYLDKQCGGSSTGHLTIGSGGSRGSRSPTEEGPMGGVGPPGGYASARSFGTGSSISGLSSDYLTPPESSRSSVGSARSSLGSLNSPKSSRSGRPLRTSGVSGGIGTARGGTAKKPDPNTEEIFLDTKNVFSYARHGYGKIVERCLQGGFDANLKDEYGNTLFHVSAQNGSKKIAKMAIIYGGDMDAQNKKGNTGLHFLYAYGYPDVGDYFLSKGANGSIRNMYGLTPKQGLK